MAENLTKTIQRNWLSLHRQYKTFLKYLLILNLLMQRNMVLSDVVGTGLYAGGKIKFAENASEALGYLFEILVLYAQSMGIGTVWFGGTMNRSSYDETMQLDSDETILA